MKEGYDFSSKVSIIGSLVMAAAIAIFCDPLIQIFAGTDEYMRRIGGFCIFAQCIALPFHAWVAMVNMLCVGLGNAKGAFWLATARQGTCFLPIVVPMAMLFGEYGIASVQAAADVLSMALAVPIAIQMVKKIKAARQGQLAKV